jgi:hypothetical protein
MKREHYDRPKRLAETEQEYERAIKTAIAFAEYDLFRRLGYEEAKKVIEKRGKRKR